MEDLAQISQAAAGAFLGVEGGREDGAAGRGHAPVESAGDGDVIGQLAEIVLRWSTGPTAAEIFHALGGIGRRDEADDFVGIKAVELAMPVCGEGGEGGGSGEE